MVGLGGPDGCQRLNLHWLYERQMPSLLYTAPGLLYSFSIVALILALGDAEPCGRAWHSNLGCKWGNVLRKEVEFQVLE